MELSVCLHTYPLNSTCHMEKNQCLGEKKWVNILKSSKTKIWAGREGEREISSPKSQRPVGSPISRT